MRALYRSQFAGNPGSNPNPVLESLSLLPQAVRRSSPVLGRRSWARPACHAANRSSDSFLAFPQVILVMTGKPVMN